MVKKGVHAVVVLVLMVSVGLLFSVPGVASAGETKLVKIYGGATPSVKEMRIEPATVVIKPGTVVVWNNWARAAEVKVKFQEGQACDEGTDAPTGFSMDQAVCYATNMIPMGGTASLQFVKEGNYHYTVETSDGVAAKGAIKVQK